MEKTRDGRGGATPRREALVLPCHKEGSLMKGEGWVLSKRTWAPKGEKRMLYKV